MEIITGIIILVVVIFSVILHEIAHGFVAERLGDPTARLQGRLTLDPRKHIDPFMTILLPILTFFSTGMILGAAKPVPIDPFNFREGRKDIALVSIVGPLTNVLIAVIAGVILRLLRLAAPGLSQGPSDFIFFILYPILLTIAQINISLAIFNLIPIPPLDGSKIFALILPERQAAIYISLGSVGFFIILFLFIVPIGGFSLSNLMFSLISFSQKLLGI
ncbi:MAG: site-2 protease family protein [Patescibacteria group bacterium]|nr:site-2 protease family protein [Patescibacteria group bacterium]